MSKVKNKLKKSTFKEIHFFPLKFKINDEGEGKKVEIVDWMDG